MIKGLTINTTAKTIEMAKAFANKAKYYGTEEYVVLQNARKDYPTFTVVTKKSASKESYKGLTINYMYEYIEKHNCEVSYFDENEKEITMKALEAFCQMAGIDENGKKIKDAETASYGELKAWFLETYPEVKNEKENKRKPINTLLKAKKKTA